MRSRRTHCRIAILSWAICCAAWCAAGCSRQRPPAPAEPPLRAAVRHELGSPVDPPVPGGAAGGDALLVTLHGYAADTSSLPAGEPLVTRGRLIIDSASEPMATAPSAAEAVRLVVDGSSLPEPRTGGKGAVAVEEVRSPIPPRCTTVISFLPNRRARNDASASAVRIAIVSPSAAGSDRPRLLVTARPQRDTSLTPSEAMPAPRERTMVLDWPLDGPTGEFALVFPPPQRRGAKRATVFRVRIARADGDAEAVEASARILADLGRDARPAVASTGRALASALTSVLGTAALRATLAAVCAETQADVTLESSLLLDGKGLASVATPVAEAFAAAPAAVEPAQLGWLADRALLAALAKLSAGGEVAGELRAMLSARFGEVGRDAGAVADLAAASASRADFDARVRAENVIFLDDASPAARVRAFEWATRRDATGALKGYDPLGPAPQRRQAIDHYLQSLTATTQPTPNAADAAGGRHESK